MHRPRFVWLITEFHSFTTIQILNWKDSKIHTFSGSDDLNICISGAGDFLLNFLSINVKWWMHIYAQSWRNRQIAIINWNQEIVDITGKINYSFSCHLNVLFQIRLDFSKTNFTIMILSHECYIQNEF